MSMNISARGALHIMKSEAVVLSTYLDTKAVLTIGVGHTAAAGLPTPVKGMTISLGEALELFMRDLAKYVARVNNALAGAPVNQAQFDALVSFDYNTGGIHKAALTASIRKGDMVKAGEQFMGWSKPVEIIGRRRGEQRLFMTGDYGDLSHVLVYSKYPGEAKSISTAGLLTELANEPAAPQTGTPTMSRELIASVQGLLKSKGYSEVGDIDGLLGARTRGAILAFQADNNLALTGVVTDALLAELVKAPAREIAAARANATADELRAKGDEPVIIGQWIQKVGLGLIAATGLGGIVEGTASFEQITTGISNVQRLITLVSTLSPWILIGAGGCLVLHFGSRVVRKQVAAYRAGRSL